MQSEQVKYLEKYNERMKRFCKLSVAEHEHNTFTEDHKSTLTDCGYYILGDNLRRITFDEDLTLIEVGAGTGVGATYMLAGLFGDKFPKVHVLKYLFIILILNLKLLGIFIPIHSMI
jgi:hypothetical protein